MSVSESPSVLTGADRPGSAFTVLASVQFVLILAMSVLNIALPDIQQEFGAGRGELALLSASYGMSFSGMLLLGGRLSDLYGARRTLLIGTAVFAVGSVACGLAPGVWVLLVARLVQGVGAAFAVPAAMALVGIVYPQPARHARAMAVWGGLAASGGTAGMLLSGVVASLDSWRWAFVVPVAVALFAMATVPRLLPSDPPRKRGRGELDVLGAVLVTAGITMLGYGLVEAPERGWVSWPVLATLVPGVVLIAAFVRVEARVARPLLPLSFLASPRRVVALLAVFLGAAGITTVFFMLALYFQEVRGYSPLEASAAFVPFGVALVLIGLVVGRLVARFGPRPVTVAGLAIAALGLGALSRIGADAPRTGLVLGGLAVFAVGAGMVFAGATVSATADVPPGQGGLAGAVTTTALEMGPAVGLSVLATIAASRTDVLAVAGTAPAAALTSGYGFALGVAAVVFLIAAAVFACLRPPRPADRPESEHRRDGSNT